MTAVEEQVNDYLDSLVHCDNPQLRQELREKLQALGKAATPRLLELLAWEHPVVYDIRLILLQLASGDVLSAVLDRLERPLVAAEERVEVLSFTRIKPDVLFFKEVLAAVAARPCYDDLPALLRVLELGVKGAGLGELICNEVPLAVQAVLRLAETEPRPALRAALPLLRPSRHTLAVSPLGFLPERLWLARRLRKIDSLPIPAEVGEGAENLPISAQSEGSTEGAACRGT